MSTYETPEITEIGSVSAFTRGAGSGRDFDLWYDIKEFIKTGDFEWGAPTS